MHVFFNPSSSQVLPPDESHHAVNVLRLKEGDEILVLNGKGTVMKAQLATSKAKACEYVEVEKSTIQSPPFRLHVVFGILKPSDRMEWFVEKATEIGIEEITPVLCERSERKNIFVSTNAGIWPLWLSKVCSLIPPLFFLNFAHGHKDKHKSIVEASREYRSFGKSNL